MMDSKLEIILAAKDMTQQTLKTFQGRLQAITKSVFSLQGGLVTLAGGYGFGALAKSALDTASNFESMEVKLDALTKGRGKKTLEDINQWALDMPVNTLKAVNAFSMMQAMGLDPTISKMQTLVDTASIFGEQAMPRVARALGQMQTLGKLSAEELNQLSEAGINARKYLTQAFGMTVEELQKSKVSIDEIVGAIWDGLNADYAGAAKKAQQSWKGLTATFVSYITEIERKVMGAGVFDLLKTELDGINQKIADWVKNNDDLIAQKVPEYVNDVKEAAIGLYGVMKTSVNIYQGLPDGIVGVAGTGIVGRILFGGTPHGKMATLLLMANQAMAGLNENMSGFDFSAQRALKDYQGFRDSIYRITEVLSGYRDANTGQIIGEAPEVFYKVPNDRTAVNAVPETSTGPVPKAVPAATASSPRAFISAMDAHVQVYDAYNQQILKNIELQNAMTMAIEDTYDIDSGMKGYDEMLLRIGEQTESLVEETEEMSTSMIDLSKRTAWAMQENFSNVFYDAVTGELSSFADYADAIFKSVARSWSDMMGQTMAQGMFGQDFSGGGWLGSLFGPATPQAAGTTPSTGATAKPSGPMGKPSGAMWNFGTGGYLGEDVTGIGRRTGQSYNLHANEYVLPPDKLQGGAPNVTINFENRSGVDLEPDIRIMQPNPGTIIANAVLKRKMTSRKWRQGMGVR